MSLSESLQLFRFTPIEYTPVVPNHRWLRPAEESAQQPQQTSEGKNTLRMNNERVDSHEAPRSKKYADVKSRISPAETSQYLERKKIRERQRIEQILKRETEEMQECTFHPHITRTFKRPH